MYYKVIISGQNVAQRSWISPWNLFSHRHQLRFMIFFMSLKTAMDFMCLFDDYLLIIINFTEYHFISLTMYLTRFDKNLTKNRALLMFS